ncbi:MAG TPA: DNA-primase RepB domain-containing protein [Herpetosiphonaceae bacterium]|nr:DNA-primase RepB domain-containing protein [Herpetosiphonaceae bacterium]
MTPLTLTPEARRLMNFLHRGGQHVYWWAVAGQKKTSIWWQPGRPAPMPNSQHNLYFGVHPSAAIPSTNARGEPAPAAAVRSQVATIAAINCLFAEFDAKHFDGDKAAALAHIEQLTPAPSVIVDSGGGYHCYWLLDEPFILATDADRARADRAQKGWVKHVRSDEGAKDLARVLRVPGTLNFKPEYGPDFPLVRFVRADYAQLYTLDELEACLPAAQPLLAPEPIRLIPPTTFDSDDHTRSYVLGALQNARACMMAAEDGIRHETRRDEAYGLAGYLWTGTITRQDIFDALAVNFGKDQRTAEKTIWDAIAKGEEKPREVPLPEPRAAHTKQILPPTTDDDLETLERDELRRRLRAAVAERDAISAERDYWKERAVQLELQLGQVQGRNRFVTQTHGAEGIGNPGMRLTFIELKKELDRVPREERAPDQWVHIRPAYMAKCSNQNRSTISKHLKLLEDSGYIETDLRRTQNPETRAWTSATFVRPLVDLSDPTQVVIPSKPRGKQACKGCGGTNLRRKVYCADCGEVQSDEPVNPPASDVQTENQEADAVKEAISFFEGQPSQEAEAPSTGLMCHTPHKEKLATVFSSELQTAHQSTPTDNDASAQKEATPSGPTRFADTVINPSYIENRLKAGDLPSIETHCLLAGVDLGAALAAVQAGTFRQAATPTQPPGGNHASSTRSA